MRDLQFFTSQKTADFLRLRSGQALVALAPRNDKTLDLFNGSKVKRLGSLVPSEVLEHHKETEDSSMQAPSTEDARDPEDRQIDEANPRARKDKMLDKTIADTFPASDPPSSLPDPDEDSFAA